MKSKIALVAAAALATLATTAGAAEPLKPYTGKLPAALETAATKGGLQVFKPFDTGAGLGGWVVRDSNSGKDLIVYTSADGNYLLAGMMLDKDGDNMTAKFMEAHVPAPDYSLAYNDFAKAPAVTVGSKNAKATLVVSVDANCPFCKVIHELLTPSIKAGELKVQYVPVGILRSDSLPKGAGLLASKNPMDTLDKMAHNQATEQSQDPALLKKVEANTALMRKHGFNGTPTILYKVKQGKDETVFVANGVPNITEMFQRLGISGHTDELKKNPQLARFLE